MVNDLNSEIRIRDKRPQSFWASSTRGKRLHRHPQHDTGRVGVLGEANLSSRMDILWLFRLKSHAQVCFFRRGVECAGFDAEKGRDRAVWHVFCMRRFVDTTEVHPIRMATQGQILVPVVHDLSRVSNVSTVKLTWLWKITILLVKSAIKSNFPHSCKFTRGYGDKTSSYWNMITFFIAELSAEDQQANIAIGSRAGFLYKKSLGWDHSK